MPYTAGVFALYTPGNPVVTGTTIQSSWANNTLDDIETALSTCLLKDGTQTVTNNIPFAGFRLTGIGASTLVDDAIQAQQVQNNSCTQLTSVSGSNTVVGTATPTPSAYALGQVFSWIQATTNTGATTINVSSLGATTVKKNSPAGLVAIVANDLIANNTYYARFDTAGSDQFVLLNPSTPDRYIVATGLTAAGTGQSDALEVTASLNVFSTVAASTGAKLNSGAGAGDVQIIYNGGANPLTVYPHSSAAINGLAVNAGHILATKTSCRYECASTTQWIAMLSA